jgi:hypothetical protein
LTFSGYHTKTTKLHIVTRHVQFKSRTTHCITSTGAYEK